MMRRVRDFSLALHAKRVDTELCACMLPAQKMRQL